MRLQPIFKNCLNCNIVFSPSKEVNNKVYYCSPTSIKGKNQKFCSISCTRKYDKVWILNFNGGINNNHPRGKDHPLYGKKLNRGEKHWNWKGGKRGADYLERKRFQSVMQKQVFERDDYTCQLCGGKGDLQVDHIQKWSDYIELRFSMDNCRTLCTKCHYHITFGKPMPKHIKSWGHNIKEGRVQL